MGRTYVVTGTASGMGAATRRRLEAYGARVLGVDRHEAEVIADLATAEGRQRMVAEVRSQAGDAIDAVIACAGVRGGAPESDSELIVRVNYFGAVATLAGLRPLLARGNDPRAVAIASLAVTLEHDPALVELCLSGDEEAAVAFGESDTRFAYRAAKRALVRWVRRAAPSEEWAGAGIALNAIAPGVIDTPMVAEWLDDPTERRAIQQWMPQPLAAGGIGSPDQVAEVLAWLTSPANSLMTGQLLFVDGGNEAITRGDDVF